MKMLATTPFPGFYQTIYEDMLQDEEGGCGDQMIQIAGEYVESLSEDIGYPLEFESLESPKEYNFTNDIAYAYVKLGDLRKMKKELGDDRLQDEIAIKFTSCDGFISRYSNDIEDWQETPLRKWDHNQVGTILSAYTKLKQKQAAEGCALIP